jgi:hypothetical protein
MIVGGSDKSNNVSDLVPTGKSEWFAGFVALSVLKALVSQVRYITVPVQLWPSGKLNDVTGITVVFGFYVAPLGGR